MKPEEVKELFSKLDNITKLLAMDKLKEYKTDYEKINFLDNLGLSNESVALILSKTTHQVSDIRSKAKKVKNNATKKT